MDFAEAHKDWTVEDWRRVIWSDETKINHLRSDGKKWVWKKPGEELSDRLVQGTSQVWRRFSDDLGVHVLGRAWICNQD